MGLIFRLPLNGTGTIIGVNNVSLSSASNTAYTYQQRINKCFSSNYSSSNTATVTIPDLASKLSSGKKYTFACWVCLSGRTTSGWVVKGSNSWGLWWSGAETDPRWVWNENDSGKRCSNNEIASDNQWHHFVIAVDKSVSGKITTKQYIDGSRADSYPGTTFNMPETQPTGDTLTLYPYTAYISDLRLYDDILSDDEIEELSMGLACHWPLSRDGLGLDNLLKHSNQSSGWTLGTRALIDTAEYDMVTFKLTGSSADWGAVIHSARSFYSLIQNQTITVSFWAKSNISTQTQYVTLGLFPINSNTRSKYYTFGSFLPTTEWQKFTITQTVTDSSFVNGTGTISSTDDFVIQIYDHYDGANVWLKGIKVELGDKATPWTPYATDSEYSMLGLRDGIIRDVSGFQKNLVSVSNVSYDSETPMYELSTVFGQTSSAEIDNYTQAGVNLSEFTISFWMKYNPVDTTVNNPIYYGIVDLYIYNNGSLRMGWRHTKEDDSFSTNAWVIIATTPVNEWIHVAISFKSGYLSRYHNGTLNSSDDRTSTGIYAKTYGGYRFCRYSDTRRFSGNLSDFRIYEKALTADQIAKIYSEGRGLS